MANRVAPFVLLLLLHTNIAALSDLKINSSRSDYKELMKLCKEEEPMFIVHFGLHKENSCAETKERGDRFSLALYDFCCPPSWCNNAKLKAQLC